MDRMPRKQPTTASRLIGMAVESLGSADEVRALLKCSSSDFSKYCDGRKEPSWTEIDKLVAAIVREQRSRMAKNRAFLAEIRRKRGGRS